MAVAVVGQTQPDWDAVPDRTPVKAVHGGGVQATAAARLHRKWPVVMAHHGPSAGEHDPAVGGDGPDVLPGRGSVVWRRFACYPDLLSRPVIPTCYPDMLS